MEIVKQRNTPSRDIDTEVGRRAHMLMWDEKRKQRDVAQAMGIGSDSLGRKLKGERGWAIAELVTLANVLDTTVAYLVGESENPHPNGPDEGSLLPRLDSNQQPIGFKPIVNLADRRVS